MNRLVISLKIFSLLLFFSLLNIQSAQAVVAVKKVDNKEVNSYTAKTKNLSKQQLRILKRKQRKQQRLEKRLKKFQKKWERKSQKKKRFFGGITNEPKFKMGIILFLGGLVIALFDFLPLVGWLISLISGLLILIGLILMIWVLIENM